MSHRAGFVNIIGNPNVGKSTLMNSLSGEKLSIITHKAQTTRHRVMGIVNGEDYQIVFSDTPGIIKPAYLLQQAMMRSVQSAFEDADVFLLVCDVREDFKAQDLLIKLKNTSTSVIVVLNKIDISTQNFVSEKLLQWHDMLPAAEIIPVSALTGFNIPKLLDAIINRLPSNPPYFPKDELTDKPVRFFVSEIIREKILLNYNKEIPYSSEVQIEEFKDKHDLISIRAIIYVERETQKIIIIGKAGKALKSVGIQARRDIEAFLQKKVFLEIFVKVDKDWRSNQKELRRFGYELR